VKPRLHQRLQEHGHHRLRDPIRDCRHAEHSNPVAMRLWDLDRPDRGREVGPRAHSIPDLVEVVPQIGLELVQGLPVHSRGALIGLDLPPRLPHQQLGNRKRLVVGPWLAHLRFLPAKRRLNNMDMPGEPAPSLHHHPQRAAASQLLRAGPPASAASVLNAFGVTASARSLSRSWDLRSQSPYRRSPSHVPCKSRRSGSRRLYAGHRLAKNTGTRQAHPSGQTKPSVSMPSIPFDASTTTLSPPSDQALWSAFLIPT
jgi:hypothetical protein